MREQIYQLVRKSDGSHLPSKLYNIGISVVAFLSILPLMYKETGPTLALLDTVTVYLLFLDYILRWITCDYFTGRKHWSAFLLYPVTPLALVDLAALLPSLGLLGQSFRILRMLRIFKLLRYSESFSYVATVFNKERRTLGSVLVIALFYIFVSALAIFCYEPDTFNTFFDALYWATTALTTVGYGDIYPLTAVGRLISMISSLFGIAVIALPAGIVTGGFVDEMHKARDARQSEATALALKQAQQAAETAQAAASAALADAQEAAEAAQAASVDALEAQEAAEAATEEALDAQEAAQALEDDIADREVRT